VADQKQINRVARGIIGEPPNHCTQPTPQPVIKFACDNLPPVWTFVNDQPVRSPAYASSESRQSLRRSR